MQNNYQWLTILSVSLGAARSSAARTVPKTSQQKGQIIVKPFGQTKDGIAVNLYTLRNNKGAEVGICNYGGLVIFLKVPDRHGKFGDVVLGYDNLADYIKDTPYFGALIGRYGNRIAKGKFTLDGKEYTLAVNNGPNALHGGLKGSTKWSGNPGSWPARKGRRWNSVYVSKDGEEGYPDPLRHLVQLRIARRQFSTPPALGVLLTRSNVNLFATAKHVLQQNEDVFFRIPQKKGGTPDHRPLREMKLQTGVGWIYSTNADVALTILIIKPELDDIRFIPLDFMAAKFPSVSVRTIFSSLVFPPLS